MSFNKNSIFIKSVFVNLLSQIVQLYIRSKLLIKGYDYFSMFYLLYTAFNVSALAYYPT